MKALRFFVQAVLIMIAIQQSSAQIGYQVSLLNSATGEPRVAETVEVKVTLTNSEGETIHEETKKETTNDFGILSLAIGNSTTFDDVDWSKLPFFISVSVDGKLVGKSQVLTVPVAEYAKKTGTLTKELLCSKTWKRGGDDDVVTFNLNGTAVFRYLGGTSVFDYLIDGNLIIILMELDSYIFHYIHEIQAITSLNLGTYK